MGYLEECETLCSQCYLEQGEAGRGDEVKSICSLGWGTEATSGGFVIDSNFRVNISEGSLSYSYSFKMAFN